MSETTKALFKDALYQVLDNKVFRLLAVLIVFMVLPTFLIAAREEELVVLFRWHYAYTDVLGMFDLPIPEIPSEANTQVIQAAQSLLVDQVAGIFGLIFAIAATAFFVPRMVEKGAADTIFSKPVSRTALLFSRYVAGLLFVAILITVLVLGIHFGLLINSGYSDAGFLWSIPVTIYKYAILHAFSLLVAVFTRSSVAAILTTMMFFAFNGCVHGAWEIKEAQIERERIMVAAGEQTDGDDPSKLLDALVFSLDALHYVLPKTSDATLISQSLRRALVDRSLALKDPVSGLRATRAPDGFTKQAVSDADDPTIGVWTWNEGDGRIDVKRWAYAKRKRGQALEELDRQLADMGISEVKKDREWALESNRGDSRTWVEPRGERKVWRKTTFLVGNGFLFSVEAQMPDDWDEVNDDWNAIDRFMHSFEQPGLERDPSSFMERRVGWGGPLKFNLYFSVASTLAFVALLLGLASWKLSRVDF